MTLIGHWQNLTEAEKLTQTVLVAGIIEENIKNGGILGTLPVAQFQGKSAKWLEENQIPTAQTVSIGGQLITQEAADANEFEVALKIVYIQTALNHYIPSVYGNVNNYEAIQLMQNKKAMLQKLEDLCIYGDLTYSPGSLEFDGLHALAQAKPTNFDGDTLNVDMGEAGLSLAQMRLLEDNAKYGLDYWLFPKAIGRQLDAFLQEKGIVPTSNHVLIGSFNFTMDELGRRVTHWNGVPILRSDYLVAEQANTGAGSDARAKYTSGDKQYSIFGIKRGNLFQGQAGLSFLWGTGPSGGMSEGGLWKQVFFPNVEDFDAAMLRLVTYAALADASPNAICRIYDIEDVPIVP